MKVPCRCLHSLLFFSHCLLHVPPSILPYCVKLNRLLKMSNVGSAAFKGKVHTSVPNLTTWCLKFCVSSVDDNRSGACSLSSEGKAFQHSRGALHQVELHWKSQVTDCEITRPGIHFPNWDKLCPFCVGKDMVRSTLRGGHQRWPGLAWAGTGREGPVHGAVCRVWDCSQAGFFLVLVLGCGLWSPPQSAIMDWLPFSPHSCISFAQHLYKKGIREWSL